MIRNMRVRVALGAAAVWFAAGCGGSESGFDASGWGGSMRDSAGISVVSNTTQGVWTAADRWAVSEELRIGTTDGDPSYQFAQISGIAELSDGRLAVMDAQGQELRLFSADGKHLRTIGRAGAGPGEFGVGAGPVLIGPGDSIYVPDITNQRLNRFSPNADPAGSSPLEFAAGIPMAWQDTPEGLLISQVRQIALPGQTTVVDSLDRVLARGSDGVVLDTLMSFPSGGTLALGGATPEITFFSPEPVWSTTSTGGLVFGYNDTYRLSLYQGDEVVRIIEKPFERRAVSEADQALLKEAMQRLWQEFGMPEQALAVMRDMIGFAERYPAFAQIRGGPEGSIWVQHLRTPSDIPEERREAFDPTLGFGSPTWDVFDPEGRFLGELEMPEGFQPIRITNGRIYGIWTDELDVPYVMVLRVHAPGEALESGAS